MLCIRWTSRRRSVRSGCARSWPNWWTVPQRWCSATAARLSQFTGDGIMAVFGAPITLEDHAVRACLAALGIQEEAKRLAVEVQDRDGVELRLRVGLELGSGDRR